MLAKVVPDSAVEGKPATNPRERWRERIAEHACSGLSIDQFYKDCDIAEHVFYAWRRRLRRTEPVPFALVDRGGEPQRRSGIWS